MAGRPDWHPHLPGRSPVPIKHHIGAVRGADSEDSQAPWQANLVTWSAHDTPLALLMRGD